jgi:hypothetical protein
MDISRSAITYKCLLLGLLLICTTVVSADARSVGKADAVSHLYKSGVKDFQDNKRRKNEKTKDPETKKPEVQRVDPDKQDPKKPEIKEVPKARKQLKPGAVKPKVKQVKVIRPKIKKH